MSSKIPLAPPKTSILPDNSVAQMPEEKAGSITFCSLTKIFSAPTKQERLAARNEIIKAGREKAKNMPSPNKEILLGKTDRLEFNNKAIERAKMADQTYSLSKGNQITEEEKKNTPEGWKMISKSCDEKTEGFCYAVYEEDPKPDGRAPETVMAFRGTRGSPTEGHFVSDWYKANIKQALGFKSDQYSDSITIAQQMKETYPNLEITGHSKAGGQAAAAAMVTDSKAYTFNPAGVNKKTVPGVDLDEIENRKTPDGRPLIDKMVVDGEIVDKANNYGPSSNGKMHILQAPPDTSATERHKMSTILQVIEDQKTEDIINISNDTNPVYAPLA